jgi:hypothetical protein
MRESESISSQTTVMKPCHWRTGIQSIDEGAFVITPSRELLILPNSQVQRHPTCVGHALLLLIFISCLLISQLSINPDEKLSNEST